MIRVEMRGCADLRVPVALKSGGSPVEIARDPEPARREQPYRIAEAGQNCTFLAQTLSLWNLCYAQTGHHTVDESATP